MNDERDELIHRAVLALSPLPAVDARATARIVAAVRTRRRPSRIVLAFALLRDRSVSLTSAGLLMAAALVLGFISRGSLTAVRGSSGNADLSLSARGTVPAVTPAVPVVAGRRDAQAVPVPVVFEERNAKSVAIVGDFNGWDATATPMQRFGVDGPWSATILAKPGRHVYAFLVDGTTLMADPRAPRARDLDYGGDASVLMVPVP